MNSQDGDREVDSFYATTYLMSTDELESYFPYFSKIQLTTAYENIEKIKGMCEDFSLLKELFLEITSFTLSCIIVTRQAELLGDVKSG